MSSEITAERSRVPVDEMYTAALRAENVLEQTKTAALDLPVSHGPATIDGGRNLRYSGPEFPICAFSHAFYTRS